MFQTLTGTWEDIKTHDAELAGRHVKLIVDETADINGDAASRVAALEEWFGMSRPSLGLLLDDSRSVIYGDDPDRG